MWETRSRIVGDHGLEPGTQRPKSREKYAWKARTMEKLPFNSVFHVGKATKKCYSHFEAASNLSHVKRPASGGPEQRARRQNLCAGASGEWFRRDAVPGRRGVAAPAPREAAVSFILQKPPSPGQLAAPYGTRELCRGQEPEHIPCSQLLPGADMSNVVPFWSLRGIFNSRGGSAGPGPASAAPLRRAPRAPGREVGATSALCLFNLFCVCFRCSSPFCYMRSSEGFFCVAFPPPLFCRGCLWGETGMQQPRGGCDGPGRARVPSQGLPQDKASCIPGQLKGERMGPGRREIGALAEHHRAEPPMAVKHEVLRRYPRSHPCVVPSKGSRG
ncbi:uncharacterized protein LOC120758738 [Hirundo rustica]|uniref:uncharacterized protein LOC120758738 n=1 Tax=Hirundo rustica TaxID=43150 RepID=UPI001A94DD9A|nr:uncharacterized protein LOC120758738 [Hirundo rustica]